MTPGEGASSSSSSDARSRWASLSTRLSWVARRMGVLVLISVSLVIWFMPRFGTRDAITAIAIVFVTGLAILVLGSMWGKESGDGDKADVVDVGVYFLLLMILCLLFVAYTLYGLNDLV